MKCFVPSQRIAGVFCAVLLVGSMPAAARQAPEPIASVWYRGEPKGVPRKQDLETIRAAGFAAVTWPTTREPELLEITRLANDVGLKLVVRDRPVPARLGSTDDATEFADVPLTDTSPGALWPGVWRLIAHGARVISFDPGPRFSFADASAPLPPAMGAAAAIARQIGANSGLFQRCRPGPRLALDGRARDVDTVLLDAGKSWVLVATNVSAKGARVTARLPDGVPYAMWLNLLDGSTMAMLEQPGGPKWVFDIEGQGVRMYVIDKVLK